jgi:hypothetical protein
MPSPDPETVDRCVRDGPQAPLERVYIEEYLQGKGYDIVSVHDLPEDEFKRLMREACIYASTKLAEVESKARFRKDIQAPHK